MIGNTWNTKSAAFSRLPRGERGSIFQLKARIYIYSRHKMQLQNVYQFSQFNIFCLRGTQCNVVAIDRLFPNISPSLMCICPFCYLFWQGTILSGNSMQQPTWSRQNFVAVLFEVWNMRVNIILLSRLSLQAVLVFIFFYFFGLSSISRFSAKEVCNWFNALLFEIIKNDTGCLFQLFLPIFSTKMKNVAQPTRATFSRNFQYKKTSCWLGNFFPVFVMVL